MTDEAVTVAQLEVTRIELVDLLVKQMPEAHRRLLLSVESGTPDWMLLGIARAADLPAVKWRLQNIAGLTDAQRADNAATRSIKEARTDRVMLTYKEIDAFFGISRATVARRLKDGLAPGIRMLHGRVLEDGPVRRLDRTQLLYLLLAVRSGRS